jgi:hypothetical protein
MSKGTLKNKNHAYNPSTWEADAGGSKIQHQSGIHSEFKGNLNYTLSRPYLEKTKAVAQLWHTCLACTRLY